jgi:predicted nuclease with TOPRIM domain
MIRFEENERRVIAERLSEEREEINKLKNERAVLEEKLEKLQDKIAVMEEHSEAIEFVYGLIFNDLTKEYELDDNY